MRIRLFAALTLAACSGNNDKPDPITCSASDRTGTYLMSYEAISGNCGAIASTLVPLENAAQVLPEGCTLDAPDKWSDGECKIERQFTCTEETIGAGVTSRAIAVSTQDTDDGSHISGTVTVRIIKPDGTQLCVGTYRVTGVRQ